MQSSSQQEHAPAAAAPANTNLVELRRLLTKYNYNDIHRRRSHYAYGTAGFRYPHEELPAVMLRVGIAAALLASINNNTNVGVMVTASHNFENYNGVKLAGPDGGMVDATGEALAVSVVNERNIDALLRLVVETKLKEQQQSLQQHHRVVHLGRDTRAHSPHLACLVRLGAIHTGNGGVRVHDHGVVTTPMLHHCVRHANAISGRLPHFPMAIPVRLNSAGYYELLVQSYTALLATKQQEPSQQQQCSKQRTLTVDCACGVGYPHLQEIVQRLAACNTTTTTTIRPTNPPGAGPLNEACGSEYVQKEQKPCQWYEHEHLDNDDNNSNNSDDIDTSYCASLDGDADRIVFFSCSSNSNDSFILLDGDKMACLIANFVRDQLQAVVQQDNNDNNNNLQTALPKLGVVQTAYANGASTDYLQQNGVAVAIAKTGVKYVHQTAHDLFDIGVYFEANGHGTVLFGPAYYDFLAAAADRASNNNIAAAVALQRLRLLPSLINQAVGDALSDLLLVDAILQLQDWSIQHWSAALYHDKPSRQCTVRVADRTVIRVNDNETECVAPAGVQAELEAAMRQCCTNQGGRAFVRPSGTEDVVRVYAEAATSEEADALAARAAEIVVRLCGGVTPPSATSQSSKL